MNHDATLLLSGVARGDSVATAELLDLVYEELRRLARSKLAREASGQTLQATALVHEAWLRLVADRDPSFANRAHFFASAAEAMRRILIERARQKLAMRHGGGLARVEAEWEHLDVAQDERRLLYVHEALDGLAASHPVQAEVVKLRYFAGMSNGEIAEILGLSVATVKNYWTFARAWLLRDFKEE